VLRKSAAGAVTEAGAVAATSAVVVRPAATANLAAVRAPSLAASIATMTGRAGQAVAFIAHAAPRAMAAASHARRRVCVVMQASVKLRSASTGRSVSPCVSGRASTGEPKAKAVLRSALPGLASRNAAARTAAAVMPIQSLGLPAAPCRPSAPGRPKIAIAGSYGLYSRVCEI
jgi:hypothetical protein